MDDLRGFELWKQGAEGRIYRGVFFDRPAVVKERFTKAYRHPSLDQHLTHERFRNEARMLVRCKAAGLKAPTVYYADYQTNRLCLEYFTECRTVKDFIDAKLGESDEKMLVALMELIGKNVALLHDSDMIHGDLTTSNLILPIPHDRLDLHFIDFGLGYVSHSAEDKSVDLYVLERAFLSTHPNTERLFARLMQSYFKACRVDGREIARKFHEVRMRGRKRVMIG
ncbi:TP53-regulating kinase [Hypsibius exemplaris]|uniref:non-specific serine/threonine protein kinase n=1 Tax=Hypsibius exemplaris TaxID=2072580 RepID=A0A1W0WPV9_HYPEX|nr:TP53-regulating kinase [Hypsibius exemplaris]